MKRLREERGLSQASLAEISGVPRPTIAHLESGQANPTLSVVTRVARALDVSVDGLVDEGRAPLALLSVRELPVKKSSRSRRVTILGKGGLREPEVEWLSLRPEARLKLETPPLHSHVLLVLSGRLSIAVDEKTAEVGPEGVARASADAVLATEEGAEILLVLGRNP